MVKVDVALDPGVIVVGLKVQVRPEIEEQLSEIGLLNPPTPAALIMRLAEPPGVTATLWAERLKEKFGLPTAAEGTRLANTLVVLPPVGKLGWLLPPAVRYRVPAAPEMPPPPNAISHNPGFTSTLFDASVI
jgi:hypothetical protein